MCLELTQAWSSLQCDTVCLLSSTSCTAGWLNPKSVACAGPVCGLPCLALHGRQCCRQGSRQCRAAAGAMAGDAGHARSQNVYMSTCIP